MSNIEKLAIENKMIVLPENIDGNRCVVTDLTQLEAFAKALQSSEPVAEVRCRNGEVFGYIPSRVLRDMLPLGTKLFTHPPATVPLEKYNKLLDALKELIEEKVENREYAPANVLIKITAEHRAKLLIAEAEGKEG